MKVKIKKLHKDAVIPKYQTSGASGFDFHTLDGYIFLPNETKIIPTGLSVSIMEGYEMQIRPRSGVSLKTPLRIVNSPGTIDVDFFGEIGILIQNTSDEPFTISKGYRIAQGVICPVLQVEFEEVDELGTSDRNTGAYGSTGV